MKLGGILTESHGYPFDDPDCMVWAALNQCLRTCRTYGVPPIGTFEMKVMQSQLSFAPDRALRWEFTPSE